MDASSDPAPPRSRRPVIGAAAAAVLILVIVIAVAVRSGPTSTVTADEEFVDVKCDGNGARGLVVNDTTAAITVEVDVAFRNSDGELLHRGGRTGIAVSPESTAPWSINYEKKFVPERLRGDHPNCVVTLAEDPSS